MGDLGLSVLLPDEDEEVEEGSTYEDRAIPGEGEEIKLSDEDRKTLARELCDELVVYDRAQQPRVDRWDEIEDAYDLVSKGHGGEVGESQGIVSEWLMSVVDQASARIEEAILGADPLIRVKPLAGDGEETGGWAKDATSAEHVLNNYVRQGAGFDRELPVSLHRTTKLGTAVYRIGWRRKKWVARWYDEEGDEQAVPQETGGIHFERIENRAAIVWPANIVDWQDAELVGHRATYSHHKWRQKARELDLDEKTIALVEAADGDSGLDSQDDKPKDLDPNKPSKTITELWCDRPLPGESENTRFQVLLHEASTTALKIFPNRHREQQHPYYPIRFKLTDKSAWGDGLGDEALTSHAVESALRTLELDNLMAGAYWITWVQANSLTDINLDSLRPGEVLRGDDSNEFKPTKMGGDAPEVGAAIEKNRFYGREATGMASVLAGQGDPTMKSGAGTGSTLALIEQASTKFNGVGRRIKTDLAAIFGFTLDLLAQFAKDGQLYQVATREDAGAIQVLRWIPPRARIRDIFHVEVQAPSAATSAEARKQSYLMLWQFTTQFVKTIIEAAGPALQQENPQGYARWLREWGEFMVELCRRIVDHHDLPGMKEQVPALPVATPEDQIIQQLQQGLQEAEGRAQKAEGALQQHLAMMQQGMQGMPGGGMQGGGMPGMPPMGPQGIVRG
jgi:hypothetical protein